MNSDSFLASGLSSPLLSHTLHCMWGWELGLGSCLSFLWSVVCVLPKMQKSWGKKMALQLLWRDADNCGFEPYFSGHVPNALILQGLSFHVSKAGRWFYPRVQKVSTISNSYFVITLVLHQNVVTKNSVLLYQIYKGDPCYNKGVAQFKCDCNMLVL